MLNLTTKAYIAVTETLRNFKKDERGVTAIEYGLIAVAMAAFVAVVFGGGENTFIAQLRGRFDNLFTTINPIQ